MSDIFAIDPQIWFYVNMSDVIRKQKHRLVKPLSIMVDQEIKDLYDQLSADGIRVSEHLRLVIYPELERLKVLNQSAS